jgi:hypothetical protein
LKKWGGQSERMGENWRGERKIDLFEGKKKEKNKLENVNS